MNVIKECRFANVSFYSYNEESPRVYEVYSEIAPFTNFKHFLPQISPLYWQYTVLNVSSCFGMPPGTHFL